MIARELEGLDETPEVKAFPVLRRHMYRYNQVTFRGIDYLAKKSCKGCYGTGKVGLVQDPRTKQKHTIFCKCLIEQEAKNATQEEG